MRNTPLPLAGFTRIQWPRRSFIPAAIGLVMLAQEAKAGMPSVSFTEVASLRMEVISFFLVVLLLSAGAVQWIWNMLRKDFAWLPRLNYWRALGVVTLWGLLFVVVLTMISGARELMTPGAWEKNGATYKLAAEPKGTNTQATASHSGSDKEFVTRTFQILALTHSLQQQAERDNGKWPTLEEAQAAIPARRWAVPGFPKTSYIYVPGPYTNPNQIVVHEPQVFTGDVLAITADGQLVQLPYETLMARIKGERASATTEKAKTEAPSDAEPSP